MTPSLLHILVVEDDALVRMDILSCLRKLGYPLLSAAANAAAARQVLEEELPDLVLLDIDLGKGGSGIELGRLINEQYRLPFIYLTGHAEDQVLAEVKETLPAGFVLKPFDEVRLKVALELARHTYYAVLAAHWKEKPDINDQLVEPLTRRENELLTLICQGLSNRELADALSVSVNTIKTHLRNLYLKLEVRNRAEAIIKVRKTVG
jgi:DNA-binding NarL/FixJ family response regulator